MAQLHNVRVSRVCKRDGLTCRGNMLRGVSGQYTVFSICDSHAIQEKPVTRFIRFQTLRENKYHSRRLTQDTFRLHASLPAEYEKQSNTEEDNGSKKFNWFKNWWAVQAVDNLKTDRPNKIKLLNKDFIVWKAHSGSWIAMDDQCPHRMAPLSEGRIEKDGNLLCSYHAWRFNVSGRCVKIPHAEDDKAHSIACNSPRSAVQTYPCQARGALLWIWPDNSVSAIKESAAVSLPIEEVVLDNFERESETGVEQPYVRYLPYSYDILMENLCDPSHFCVSHHNLTPLHSRYSARPLNASNTNGLGDIPTIAAMSYTPIEFIGKQGLTELRHPAVISLIMEDNDTRKISFLAYFIGVPVSSGQSLIITLGGNPRVLLAPREPRLLEKILLKPISWSLHTLLLNKVLDGDSVLLQIQDKKLRNQGHLSRASKKYFTPTSADILAVAFRKWFETIGEYGAAYGGDQLYDQNSEAIKEILLDRYEQHTKHCRVCTEALENIRKSITVLKSIAVVALITGTCLLLKKSVQGSLAFSLILRSRGIVASVVCLVLSAAVAYLLETKLIPQFYFVDFNHADND